MGGASYSGLELKLSTELTLGEPGVLGISGLGVSWLGVSGLGVNGLGVNGLGVSWLGVSRLGVRLIGVWWLSVRLIGVSWPGVSWPGDKMGEFAEEGEDPGKVWGRWCCSLQGGPEDG